MKELIEIQNELKVPKTHWNEHGKYFYRNNNEILEALKPLCKKHNCLLILSDGMISLGDRFYVKSTATLSSIDGEMSVSVSANAREPLTNNAKMDASQITGSASSYARKGALGGLFLIDDNKDADSGSGELEQEKLISQEQIKLLENYAKDYRDVDNKKHSFIIDFISDPGTSFKEAEKVIKRIKDSK